ncbi:unnamed protein product [Caenorhabditis angaria]|uniref:CC domain-containing protein n=1 Tax=Caenorhabditis angaria TaxID=860376 RepID=A0A9P1J0G4_9PELO|nr:unnamed protein product [Caenorhabditis angaria]
MNTSLIFLSAFIAVIAADCYFPFLTATGPCSSDADCGGSACVMDINSGSRVCCKPKPGTISPKCSSGSYSGLPILCDPADGDDGCPSGSTCQKSSTDFTKGSDPASPNSLCCKS